MTNAPAIIVADRTKDVFGFGLPQSRSVMGAPLLGQVLSDLVLGRDPGRDLSPFLP